MRFTRFMTLWIALLTAFVGIALIETAAAADQPKLLIMGVDGGEKTLKRTSRPFKAASDYISGRLDDAGFKIFQEAQTVNKSWRNKSDRRGAAEATAAARSVTRPSMDMAVLFTIQKDVKRNQRKTKLNLKAIARVIDIQSGNVLTSVKVKTDPKRRLPADCDRSCLQDTAIDDGRVLIPRLADKLVKKLKVIASKQRQAKVAPASYSKGGYAKNAGIKAFSLVFKKFEWRDMRRIDKALERLGGYRDHSTVGRTGKSVVVWFETDANKKKLAKQLDNVLRDLELSGRLIQAGTSFTITHIAPQPMAQLDY